MSHWRKSSHSSGQGACVEVAELRPVIAVRDSKDPEGPRLMFSAIEWQSFTDEVKSGRFELA